MSGYDPRFDEAVDELDSWRQWRPKTEEGTPNPLVIVADSWQEGIVTDFGPVDILRGTDRHGSRWSIMAGGKILQKGLIEGIVEEWDDQAKAFVTRQTLGRVKPGELVAVSYEGEGQGAKFNYSKYKIVRKPERVEDEAGPSAKPSPVDEDIPF